MLYFNIFNGFLEISHRQFLFICKNENLCVYKDFMRIQIRKVNLKK